MTLSRKSETRYYQVGIAMDGGDLSAEAAKRIADFILGELDGRRPAVVVAAMKPLAGAPVNFPTIAKESR